MATTRIKVGDWTAKLELNLLERNGQSVQIEPRAMDLLTFLAHRAGEVFSSNDLIAEIWRGRVVGDDSVYRIIKQLRDALDDDAHNPRYIATIPRRGYSLIAPVEIRRGYKAGTSRFEQIFPRRWQQVTTLSLLALLILAISLFVSPWSPVSREGQFGDQTIAVLPFVDLSADEANAYLGEGIAGEIIHALSNGSGLRVISRTSAFSFGGSTSDIREIGERLGASVILEGSVRRENGRLRIIAQLVDAESGAHLWSDDFDRPAEDLITVERDVALAVADRLVGDAADPERIAAALPALADISAYEYYLLGRERVRRGRGASMINWSQSDADHAVGYFRRAIAADPEFARAYSSLAEALLYRTVIGRGLQAAYENGIPPAVAEEALSAIDRALELQPDLADALVSRGFAIRLLEGDRERALDLFREAIELNPNLVEAYYALGRAGTGEEASAAMVRAAELAPMSADILLWAGRRLSDIGRPVEALHHLERAVTLEDPPSSALLLVAGRRQAEGRPDEAIRLLQPHLTRDDLDYDEPRIRAWLAGYHLDLNDRQAARELLGLREPREPFAIGNARLHLAIAEGNDDLIADILHERTIYDDDYSYALYEQLIGHDDHARAQYEVIVQYGAIAGEEEYGPLPDRLFSWGYAPALNWALLYREAGNEGRASELLGVARQAVDETLLNDPEASGAYYVLAGIEAIEGETAQALDTLEQAFNAGWTKHWYAERDPNLESLWEEPRFQELIADLRAEMARLRAGLQTLATAE